MIITRTPFRILFAGGGTDLQCFYSNEPGRVLSTTINKFLYVIIRKQVGLVEHKYLLKYSSIEAVQEINEIQHPIIREALKEFGFNYIDWPLEITTFTDIPAYTGLGSSSAFAVGLVYGLMNLLHHDNIKQEDIARRAHRIEVEILKRSMGKQDHYASAYGGVNVFTFQTDGGVHVQPMYSNMRALVKLDDLQEHLMLFYTGQQRDASEVLKAQEEVTPRKMETLRQIRGQVNTLYDILESKCDLLEFGRVLNQGWHLKRSLTNGTSTPEIDQWYEKAKQAGAIGGKVLGAGGGGFLLLFVEPHLQAQVIEALQPLQQMPFTFTHQGTKVIYRED